MAKNTLKRKQTNDDRVLKVSSNIAQPRLTYVTANSEIPVAARGISERSRLQGVNENGEHRKLIMICVERKLGARSGKLVKESRTGAGADCEKDWGHWL